MKKILAIAMALCLGLVLLSTTAFAEAVPVRVMLSYFNANIIESETTDELYQDFENVDSDASIMYFQEYYLKQKFPELTLYGTSADNVLAYTDIDGKLYDGVYDTIGQLVNPETGRAEIYLWLGSTYMYFLMGESANDDDSIIYDFLSDEAYSLIMPEYKSEPSPSGIIATAAPITQVFLNSRSIQMRVKDGDAFVPFTEAVIGEAGDALRLTLTTVEPSGAPMLTYSEIALFYLDSLGIAEVCLLNGGAEQVYTIDTLMSLLG